MTEFNIKVKCNDVQLVALNNLTEYNCFESVEEYLQDRLKSTVRHSVEEVRHMNSNNYNPHEELINSIKELIKTIKDGKG